MVRPRLAGRAPIGIVDWGIGGIGLVGLLDRDLPELPLIYWSDTGSVPYGKQAPGDLTRRLCEIVEELAARGCVEVVLACNAASTVVDRLVDVSIPVTGIIEHGIDAVPAAVDGVVGVVGGAATIRSGAYRRGLSRPGRTVVSRIAQPLSAHIEAGRIGTPAFDRDLAHIVGPLRGATAVVLACTHYPAAADAFARELPGTLLVDPAVHLAADLVARHADRVAGGPGQRTFLTTGDPSEMRAAARAAWGTELGMPGPAPNRTGS